MNFVANANRKCNVEGCEEHKRRHTRKHSKDPFTIPEWPHFYAFHRQPGTQYHIIVFFILTYHFMVVDEKKTTRNLFVRIQFMPTDSMSKCGLNLGCWLYHNTLRRVFLNCFFFSTLLCSTVFSAALYGFFCLQTTKDQSKTIHGIFVKQLQLFCARIQSCVFLPIHGFRSK